MPAPDNYFNFLPPKDQYTESVGYIPQNIGNINFLDDYISSYQITKGDIYPILIDPSTGLATNLTGSTGPSGCTGGSIGTPAPTPFIMSTYTQALNNGASSGGGIVQFILLSSNYSNGNGNGAYDYIYYFVSASDYTNYYNAALIYYSISSDDMGTKTVKFYDAKLVNKNPTVQVNTYELYSVVYGPYGGNDNTFSAWPYNKNFYFDGSSSGGAVNNLNYDSHITRPNFQFNELLNTGNTGPINLKSGKFYHPYNIYMTNDDGTNNGYTNYSGYTTGYTPGYPINFNYSNTPFNDKTPVVNNGFDTQPNQFNLIWPNSVSLNLYNFTSENINANIDYTNLHDLIDDIGNKSPSGFLSSSITCSSNNECDNTTNSYYANNFNTIQAGIAQYLVYQFIPVQQITTPPTNIITNYTNTYLNQNTTLPPGITFTPSNYTYINGVATGATGSFPTVIQTLYDGNTGNTGTASSNIIQSWMKDPLNAEFACGGISQNTSYCGFTDYYDSLFGISYIYGTCGATGTDTNPYQKGECSNDGSKICVPNFKYLQNLDQYINPPYICVSNTTGISNTNLEAYIDSVPIGSSGKNNGTSLVYPPYQQTQVSNQAPNYGTKKETGTNYIFIAIAVVLLIILIIVIFYAIFKRGDKSSLSIDTKIKRVY